MIIVVTGVVCNGRRIYVIIEKGFARVKSIKELDMGLKYLVFTTFMDQSLILTLSQATYEKLLIL